jgi:hypothetical protein
MLSQSQQTISLTNWSSLMKALAIGERHTEIMPGLSLGVVLFARLSL